jgi:hypothetical protein
LTVALWHEPTQAQHQVLFKSEDPAPLDDALLANVEHLFEVEIYPGTSLLGGEGSPRFK